MHQLAHRLGGILAWERGSRRLWVAGRRCHHGAAGLALAVSGLALPNPYGPVLFGLGVALIADDWGDRFWAPARRARL